MAEIERLISTKKLKTGLLGKMTGQKPQLFFFYDNDLDELIIMVVSPDTETVVHYADDHVAILYTPDTMEVVGLQVDDFESSFVPKYASLQKAWRISDVLEGFGDKNVWDLGIMVEEMKPEIAREVAKASEAIIGKPAKKLEKVLEYA